MTKTFRAFMRVAGLLSILTCLAVTPALAQKINPTNQINWPLASGSGAPTAACSSINYGQPYTDIANHISYACGNAGWFQSSGSTIAGVTSINSTAGAFTFNFAPGAGSCSGTTCTFSGAAVVGGVTQLVAGSGISLSPSGGTGIVTVTNSSGAGGVTPGTLFYSAYYSSSGTVASDGAFRVTTPTVPNTDQLQWVGGGGLNFTNNAQGGSFNFAVQQAVENNLPSQLKLSTNLVTLDSATNPGLISITTSDSGSLGSDGNSNAANILISANETTGAALDGSGNVTISASASYASPGSGASNSGDVTISASNPNGEGGNISLNASSPGGGKLLISTGNLTLDAPGNLTVPFSVNAGAVHTGAVYVNDTTGAGGGLNSTQGTAPSGVSGSDLLWADLVKSRWLMNNNNAGAQVIPGVTTAGTPGHCWQVASDGYGLVDAGFSCNSGTTHTPTEGADAGAGTGGSLSISFVTGANDDNGYINLTTGASPAANSGVITVTFGGTYAAARKCSVSAASSLAMALGGNGFYVGSGTSTSTAFVIDIGATPLPANTTGYVINYRCGN